MAMRNFFSLIILSVLVSLINGYDLRGKRQAGTPTPEECMRPPMSKFGHECCRLPKERIWGDLRKSLNLCMKKTKQEPMPSRQEAADDDREMVTPEGAEITPTEAPGESVSVPSTSTYSTTTRYHDRRGGPRGKRPHYMRRHANDSCFMECVFENQGFLLNKMINKAALIEKLSDNLRGNEPWQKAAIAAAEVCYQTVVSNPSNETCNSGSEQVFRCVFKQLFFNCPNWTQNEYCMSLKEFYQKCPNGPPPEIDENHSTPIAPEEDVKSNPSTVAYTES